MNINNINFMNKSLNSLDFNVFGEIINNPELNSQGLNQIQKQINILWIEKI